MAESAHSSSYRRFTVFNAKKQKSDRKRPQKNKSDHKTPQEEEGEVGWAAMPDASGDDDRR